MRSPRKNERKREEELGLGLESVGRGRERRELWSELKEQDFKERLPASLPRESPWPREEVRRCCSQTAQVQAPL